jgi:diaminopimelate decarboxylase
VDHFQRHDGVLHAEGVALSDIAARFGTPTYVYSRATISRHVDVLGRGLHALDHLICYAVKANGNLALLQLLEGLGCGFDAVSVGELARVLKVGADPARVIVSGVGKRDDEIAAALEAGVAYICVESAEELAACAAVAETLDCTAPVSVRVNPDVDPKTHPYISTGLKENKFGVALGEARLLYQEGLRHPRLNMVGVTCHIGSQITSLAPFEDAAHIMRELAQDLRSLGVPLRYLGMGGGLGVPYVDEAPPSPERYGEALATILGPLGLTLVFEPGRVIMGNAGVLLSRVVRTKRGADRSFVVLDAGMNDLIRPALYAAHHRIEPVGAAGEPTATVDVVGPVCESADTFAKGAVLPALAPGDLVALRTAGAYGFAMASTYNGRPLPAEVLVDGEQAWLIRERGGLADLWRGERGLDGKAVGRDLPAILSRRRTRPRRVR